MSEQEDLPPTDYSWLRRTAMTVDARKPAVVAQADQPPTPPQTGAPAAMPPHATTVKPPKLTGPQQEAADAARTAAAAANAQRRQDAKNIGDQIRAGVRAGQKGSDCLAVMTVGGVQRPIAPMPSAAVDQFIAMQPPATKSMYSKVCGPDAAKLKSPFKPQ